MPTDSSSKVVGRCNRLGKRCTYLNVVEKRKSPSSASYVLIKSQRLV
ncbi:hypothetical protein FGSG_12399 [Fusarium graminearum PH-1]|nr:hypothetical protein FGSG_12399 [Fusarium graminearum PH-1]ESU09536.1 hypothetical protein FGSG_12399 [Fusarium graminearum PH-1]|eukprot:XP_011322035.1 hypothetical protein FGSG_12399 [Fusarium graminearum PH-1]